MTDRDSAPWWERVERGEFAVQECAGCGLARWPARAFCASCHAERWTWRAVEPLGRIESWIVNHRPFPEGSVVVLVRLDAVPGALVPGGWSPDREPVGGEAVRARLDAAPILWGPVSG
ncbi:zinc ribbon domain-containing protein [Nonomuraea sp. NBC_01738]|uniref:Zn-ribbon domain-containing OB-fold protein n=1 Tax=Nonomuraea sp. NBC_01738 TaxID=2976003 RepID=UPI002E0EB0CC|nr:zinc ribbon domain-containing protein [Nonomuraea sp. NBC_01738]